MRRFRISHHPECRDIRRTLRDTFSESMSESDGFTLGMEWTKIMHEHGSPYSWLFFSNIFISYFIIKLNCELKCFPFLLENPFLRILSPSLIKLWMKPIIFCKEKKTVIPESCLGLLDCYRCLAWIEIGNVRMGIDMVNINHLVSGFLVDMSPVVCRRFMVVKVGIVSLGQ